MYFLIDWYKHTFGYEKCVFLYKKLVQILLNHLRLGKEIIEKSKKNNFLSN